MSKSVNVDFVTRQIEVDTDGKEYYVSAAVAAKDAEQSMLSAQNAAKEVKEIYGDGNFTPLSDLLGGLGTKLKRWGSIFANKVFASNLPIVYNSVAEMTADTMLWEGMSAKTLGYYAPNDGGGANYLIRAKTDSDVDDGGSLHELSNGLVAELIIENGTVNVKQFGAVGDGVTDDTQAIQTAINHKCNVVFSKGKYKITSTITTTVESHLIAMGTVHINSYVNGATFVLLGDNASTTTYEDVSVPAFSGCGGHFLFRNKLSAAENSIGIQIGIESDTTKHNGFMKLSNIQLHGYNIGLLILPIHAYLMTFERIHFYFCTNGVQTGKTGVTQSDSGENIKWIDCLFDNCTIGMNLVIARIWEHNFDMCSFDFCPTVFYSTEYSLTVVNISNSHIEGIAKNHPANGGLFVGTVTQLSRFSLTNCNINQYDESATQLVKITYTNPYNAFLYLTNIYIYWYKTYAADNDWFLSNIPTIVNNVVSNYGGVPFICKEDNKVYNGDFSRITPENPYLGFTHPNSVGTFSATAITGNPVTGGNALRIKPNSTLSSFYWAITSEKFDVQAGQIYSLMLACRSDIKLNIAVKYQYYHNDTNIGVSDEYTPYNQLNGDGSVHLSEISKIVMIPKDCNKVTVTAYMTNVPDNNMTASNYFDFLYLNCEKIVG